VPAPGGFHIGITKNAVDAPTFEFALLGFERFLLEFAGLLGGLVRGACAGMAIEPRPHFQARLGSATAVDGFSDCFTCSRRAQRIGFRRCGCVIGSVTCTADPVTSDICE